MDRSMRQSETKPTLSGSGRLNSNTTTNCGRVTGFTISIAMACAICMLEVGGCQKVLFPESEPRNQFERSDNLRDRFTPVTEPDVFGNPKPALRARLSPPTG